MNSLEKYLNQINWTEKLKQIKLKKKLYLASRTVAILVILFAFILLVERVVTFLKMTYVFSVDNIIINGNKVLSMNDILQAGELTDIKNIFEVDLGKLETKLQMHPRIKNVTVNRRLPHHLIISVEERQPVALVNKKEGTLYKIFEVDEEGYIIGKGDTISNYDLPVYTGIRNEEIFLGEKIKDEKIISIIRSFSQMNKKVYNFERLLAEINIRDAFPEYEVRLILNEQNIPVFLGSVDISKLEKLNSLIMVVYDRLSTVEYIDFKYDDAVIKWRNS
ncbi:MAG: FtsQ-type POTRA domain-containing protein [Spirochaetes bacterium]|nr:FtsQ-type POTRA domain-containing protein [Spirochaetota bacterium]